MSCSREFRLKLMTWLKEPAQRSRWATPDPQKGQAVLLALAKDAVAAGLYTAKGSNFLSSQKRIAQKLPGWIRKVQDQTTLQGPAKTGYMGNVNGPGCDPDTV